VGDTLNEAYEKCEEGLSCITGDNLFYRKDIGSPELSESYRDQDLLPD
jgi:phosphoribosylamine-glycine ligase